MAGPSKPNVVGIPLADLFAAIPANRFSGINPRQGINPGNDFFLMLKALQDGASRARVQVYSKWLNFMVYECLW